MKQILVAAAILGLMAPMPPALAQSITASALGGLDRKAPIDVDADRIEVLDRENQAIFSGNVLVRQASLTLEAERVKVNFSRPASGDPQMRRLDADGNVRITTPSERATSRFGIYDVEQRILTLVGNVVLTQGTTRVQGNRLTINLASGQTRLDGASATGKPGGRVQGRFAVPEKR